MSAGRRGSVFAPVFLGRGSAEVADGDIHDPVWQPEFTCYLLFVRQQFFVYLTRLLGHAESVHLHLVELVHPDHAAGVLASRPGLTPEVRRVADELGGRIGPRPRRSSVWMLASATSDVPVR